MPLKSTPSILALLIASIGAPVYAETPAKPVLNVSSSTGFPQGDCDFESCVASFTWDAPPVGEPSLFGEVSYQLCMKPDDAGGWICDIESQPIQGTNELARNATHKTNNYFDTKASSPPATKFWSYKLIKTSAGFGSVESNVIRIPHILPVYYRYEGLFYPFGKSTDNYNPGFSFGFKDNGQKQTVIDIVNPSADIGTSVRVTATQPVSGIFDIQGTQVSFTPAATPDSYQRLLAKIKVDNALVQDVNAGVRSAESVVRLVAQNEGSGDSLSFSAVPATQVGTNFSLSGLKYTYTPNGSESSRTIFSYPALYTNVKEENFSIIQTEGDFCPLFANLPDLQAYMKSAIGAAKACLTEKPDDIPAGQSTVIDIYRPGIWTERLYTSDGGQVDLRVPNIIKATIKVPVGTSEEYAQLDTTVKVYDRNLNVLQSILVPYGVTVVKPSEFQVSTTNLVPTLRTKLFDLLLVSSKSVPAFEYNVAGGDTNFLKIEGSNFLPAASRRFDIETGYMTATDSRLGSVDNRTGVYKYLLNIVKETVPVSVSNRNADGTLRILVNATRAASGHYLLTLKHQSSATGEISVSPYNEQLKVGPSPTSTTVAFDSFAPNKNRTLDNNNRVAELMLSKDAVDNILATGDRLFFEASPSSDVLTDDDIKNGEDLYPGAFIDTLEINGLTGYITTSPSGEFNLTNLHSIINKPATAYLLNLKSAAKVDWLVSKNGGAVTTFSKDQAGDLDLTTFEPGTYQITPKLYAINHSLTTTLPAMQFIQYAAPTATFSYPTTMVIGSNNNLTALVSNVPPNAIATWKIGTRTVSGVISSDGKTITGVYVPVASGTAETLSLEIQINPETFDAIAVLLGPTKVNSVEALNPDISTTYKVFWSKKGGTIDYNGTKDTNKIDWIVLDTLGNVVKTKTVIGRASFNTTGLIPGNYMIKAKAYDKFGSTVESKSISFRVLLEPSATIKMGLSVVAGSAMPLTASTSNIADGALITWNIGEGNIPGTLNDTKTNVTGVFNVPLVPANYRSTLSIQVDPTNAYAVKTFEIGTIKATGYAKLTSSVEAPRFLDVGLPATYKAIVKAPWDTKVLPLNEDTLYTEWEFPNGTRLTGHTVTFTPTMDDYPLFTAGKRPIFRAWMVDDKNGTMIEVPTTGGMYEPWVFPTYSLVEKAGAANMIAPGAVLISVLPRESVAPAMATYRGITYEWSFPDAPGFSAAAKRENLAMTITQPGTFPVSVRITDKYGAEQILNYLVTATKAQFSISKMTLLSNPESRRAPTQFAVRADVLSTHKKERLKSYQTYADGILIGTGSTPKPFILKDAGDHEVTLVANSTLGNVASRTESVTIIPNLPPICQSFKLVYGTALKKPSVKANANCVDSDGKIKKFEWSVNGFPTKVTSGTQSYVFDTPDPVNIEVKVTDDSGESTTYSENIHIQ